MNNYIEKRKLIIGHLKLCSEQNICDDESKCIVNRKDLQLLMLDYMDSLKKIDELQCKLNTYKNRRDCDEEFEI